jgi:hypothetical protein
MPQVIAHREVVDETEEGEINSSSDAESPSNSDNNLHKESSNKESSKNETSHSEKCQHHNTPSSMNNKGTTLLKINLSANFRSCI